MCVYICVCVRFTCSSLSLKYVQLYSIFSAICDKQIIIERTMCYIYLRICYFRPKNLFLISHISPGLGYPWHTGVVPAIIEFVN